MAIQNYQPTSRIPQQDNAWMQDDPSQPSAILGDHILALSGVSVPDIELGKTNKISRTNACRMLSLMQGLLAMASECQSRDYFGEDDAEGSLGRCV